MLFCDSSPSSECFNLAYTICLLFHPVECELTGVYPRIQTKGIIRVHPTRFFLYGESPTCKVAVGSIWAIALVSTVENLAKVSQRFNEKNRTA